MTRTENDVLRVDVPVGDRLTEPRELLVTVDRANQSPLSIRLHLVPREADALADLGADLVSSDHDTPMPIRRLNRRRFDDDLLADDLGGSD